MAAIHTTRVLTILFIITCMYSCTIVQGAEYDEFDFDGLPGVQHEFKIEVQAGTEECFHQKVAEGANLHMSFEGQIKEAIILRKARCINLDKGKLWHTCDLNCRYYQLFGTVNYCHLKVLRGGSDRLVDIIVQDPTHFVVESHHSRSEVTILHKALIAGVYTICVDNTFSRMASKLVYVYMITFVPEEWTKYVQEIEDMNMAVTNFTHSISVVQKSLEDATLHQASSRMNVVKDWYLIMGNNSYIVKWSIAQMCVILCSSIFTVFFVRRLFNISNVTPSQKPRA